MDLTTKAQVQLLKHYFSALPTSLPPLADSSSLNQLLYFSPDQEWVLDVGEECAVNRTLEVALKDFGPRNDNGIFKITGQGAALAALPDVLAYWLEKYPQSFFLKKWLQDAKASALDCFSTHGEVVSPQFIRNRCLTSSIAVTDAKSNVFDAEFRI
jgi:hypothetical protein